MGKTITARRTQTDVPISVLVTRDGGIAGLTVVARIFNGADLSQFLDFNDGVFKDAGHTTPTLALPAIQATEAPGVYAVDGGFDLSAITVPAAASSLLVRYTITAGGESGDDLDVIQFATETIAAEVWDRILSGSTHNIPTSAGRRLRELSEFGKITDGQAQAGGASTITLEVSEPATDDLFKYMLIVITDGTGANQIRIVTAYDGTTKIATVDRPWQTAPDATSLYVIGLYQGAILTSDTDNVVRDAILDDGTRFSGADIDVATSTRESEAAAAARAVVNIAEHDATQAALALVAADVATLVVRTVDLDAAIAFFGAVLGTPVVHTPGTVTAGAYTWSVVVAGSTVTFTRLT
jgi:hypothetical protein